MNISRYNHTCQIWKLEEDVTLKTPVVGVDYEKAYLALRPDGRLQIRRGYAWNGCSPKIEWLGMVLGTPEGALPAAWEADRIQANLHRLDLAHLPWDKPKTYYASLVHDCLYQISETCADRMSRQQVDALFLALLRAWCFSAAPIYFGVVRLFGKYCWK